MTDVLAKPVLVDGAELLHQNNRGQFQTVLAINKIMRRQTGLYPDLAGNSGNNDRRAEPITYIVLDNHHRAVALLFRADALAEIGIIHITARVCSLHGKTSFEIIGSAKPPM